MPERAGQDGRARAKRTATEPRVKARADELHASGMPLQMAMAVAHGKLSLNEALEKLARRESVNRLMERHDISRALATQIALGQASLETVLARRRLAIHREVNRVRSVLDEHAAGGQAVTLLLHGHERVTGTVLAVDAYSFRFRPEEGEEREIHKLQVKVAFPPEAYKRLRKILKFQKDLERSPHEPISRPQDRYTCSDKRLFRYMDEKVEVVATLLEGEQLRGTVNWFSRYEFGMGLKGDAEIAVFRHALHDLAEG